VRCQSLASAVAADRQSDSAMAKRVVPQFEFGRDIACERPPSTAPKTTPEAQISARLPRCRGGLVHSAIPIDEDIEITERWEKQS
jgi:hypothetical protein